MVMLLCRMNKQRDGFIDMHVMPPIGERLKWLYIKRRNDNWLKGGERLRNLRDFCALVEKVTQSKAS